MKHYEFICIDCNQLFSYNPPTKLSRKPLRCPVCKKKHASIIQMEYRYKKDPTIQIGRGSGCVSHDRKKDPKKNNLTTSTFIRIKKDHCEWCGSEKNLLVHHLDGNHYNHDVSNLITLCKRCHQNYHTNRDMTTGRYKAK